MQVSVTCIGHLWVFENLKPEELGALTRAAWRKVYQRGQEVFSQGGRAKKMFLIKAGRVKLSKITEDGDELTLDIRKAGDFLGENMLLEDTNYPLTATCLEDTLVCGFTKKDFEKLVLDHPPIGLQVIKNLSKRIDWLTSGWAACHSPTWRTGSIVSSPNLPRNTASEAKKVMPFNFPSPTKSWASWWEPTG